MKCTLKIALLSLGICLVCISCKKSPTAPNDLAEDNFPLIVNPGGDIGHDLFYTYWPINSYDPDDVSSDAGIYSMNFDGSVSAFLFRRVILSSAPRDNVLLFAALDTAIYYPRGNIVYLGDLRGKTIRKIFSVTNSLYYVILSPDAQKILYSTRDSVYVYDTVSHVIHPIIAQSTDGSIYYPVFSDDSKRVLIPGGAYNGLQYGLYIINSDGSNLTLIDSSRVFSRTYDWSPDGKKICYSGTTAELLIRELATGVIDTIGHTNVIEPVHWSPLGNYIAFGDYINDAIAPRFRVNVVNARTLQTLHYELPMDIQRFYPVIEWSADEQSLYVAFTIDPTYNQRSTILKMDPLAGTIIQEYSTRGIQTGSFFRLRTVGEH